MLNHIRMLSFGGQIQAGSSPNTQDWQPVSSAKELSNVLQLKGSSPIDEDQFTQLQNCGEDNTIIKIRALVI